MREKFLSIKERIGENRLSAVSNAAFAVTYAFTPDGLDAGYAVTFTNGTVITRAVTRHPYRRGLVTGVTNAVNGVTVSAYAYLHDRLGRVITRNGDAFGYNPRSEVVAASIATNAYSYSYDSIGNSVRASRNAATNLYTANSLNQYTAILRDSAPPCEPTYDADGNLISDGNLSWDSRNRLRSVSSGGGVSEYVHDWAGRRVSKWGAETSLDTVWDGRLPAAEFERDLWNGDDLAVTRYVWGTDLSGAIHGAGGVGGLLAVKRGARGTPCSTTGEIDDCIGRFNRIGIKHIRNQKREMEGNSCSM